MKEEQGGAEASGKYLWEAKKSHKADELEKGAGGREVGEAEA